MFEIFMIVATTVVVVMLAVVVRMVLVENATAREQNARAAVYFAVRDANYARRPAALDQAPNQAQDQTLTRY